MKLPLLLSQKEPDPGGRELLWELSRRIVRLRRTRGWSRDDLARRLRVTRERLGHWERGSHSPPMKSLIDLGRVLEVSMDELMIGKTAAEGLALDPLDPEGV
jgi:transcriptional regulator with XRE-family HTH domain